MTRMNHEISFLIVSFQDSVTVTFAVTLNLIDLITVASVELAS